MTNAGTGAAAASAATGSLAINTADVPTDSARGGSVASDDDADVAVDTAVGVATHSAPKKKCK